MNMFNGSPEKETMMGQVKDIYNLPPKEFGPQDENVIECEDVSKEFNLIGRDEKVYALKEINLKQNDEFYPIKRGEFVIIRGPSGGGKTTFLNQIGTIDTPTSGSIRLLGQEVNKLSKDSYLSELRLTTIGFVFQTFNLIATMTAYENVELPMRILAKLSDKEIKKRVRELLKSVGLQDRMDHLPSELSGGEQQRVAIARSLANSPQILLLDEPTGDLDSKSTVEVMDILLKLNNFGYEESNRTPCTMIMVTHNPDLECYAHRIIYIKDGKIEKQAINERQSPLRYEQYLHYLNSQN
ncbi:unnamed protein product [Paramecium sonneborni]|uniref:ABC transporter domain-containing protein n=1 Tax=Paramecium sonneborni TaxID=65129 RepID=A0A8S1P147_9CILI|nr:unnamed protein product [Paramecium sonneborni]